MQLYKGVSLRFTLSLLVVASVTLTAIATGFSAIKANMRSLSESYKESNYQYAKKLASNTSSMLALMQNNIDTLAKTAGQHSLTQEELEQWYILNRVYFNSLLYVDSNLTIIGVSPGSAGVKAGTRLTSEQSKQAHKLQQPRISEPFLAVSGRLILLISSPVFNKDGTYAGFVGGTIYLEEDNVLHRLLNQHYYGNGSYVYVVDKTRHLVFHPDKKRINEQIRHNEVIESVLMKESGSIQVLNSREEQFFAGYAYEPYTGWGIISQTPVSVLNEPLKNQIVNLIVQAFPILILILLVSWWVASHISKPMHQLARFSEEAMLHRKAVPTQIPKIKSRIYEVKQLYQSINNHLQLLNDEIQTDALTGLANRKTFDLTIKEWMELQIPFSLIFLDIDHFKRVNDMNGHLVGDEVLKYLASIMQSFSREKDLCFRYGGEEFGILVKYGNSEVAKDISERMRTYMENGVSPAGYAITISVGISSFASSDEPIEPKTVIELADHALYQSKEDGRNRITVSAAGIGYRQTAR